ncbi:hypothetical protein V6V47_16930 [Micromonospora sp. CPCC 205539]|uniref:hypothetical protein n=1 Tax=Micromonospora sp. CPCC 205539 TaxID=3122408 RepID=UPI002FF1B54A
MATVLAVPCLGPVGPAPADTAAILQYKIDQQGDVNRSNGEVDKGVKERLMTMACDTEEFEGGAEKTASEKAD